MSKYYIYTLSDPIDNSIKYVGKTNNLEKRHREHIKDCYFWKAPKDLWIRELLKQGLEPVLTVVKLVNGQYEALQAEQQTIKDLNQENKLLNVQKSIKHLYNLDDTNTIDIDAEFDKYNMYINSLYEDLI